MQECLALSIEPIETIDPIGPIDPIDSIATIDPLQYITFARPHPKNTYAIAIAANTPAKSASKPQVTA